MKVLLRDKKSAGKHDRYRINALTIAEMMITVTIFSFVIIGLTYTHLIGLRQDELVESKLGASDMARRGFEQLATDVRGAQAHYIGNYAGGTFTANADVTPQQGNAVQLLLDAQNTTRYILYYFDSNSSGNRLCRYHTGDATNSVIANDLTNYYGGPLIFVGENFDSSVQTSQVAFRNLIHFTLGFIQYQYPLTKVGTGNNYLYDFYKIEFRLAPHVPCGR